MVLQIGGKNIEVFHGGARESREGKNPLILLNADHGEGRDVWERTRRMTDVPFSMAVVSGMNWNDDLTPWPNPATANWDSPYGGKADAYLRFLEERAIPAVSEAIFPAEEFSVGAAAFEDRIWKREQMVESEAAETAFSDACRREDTKRQRQSSFSWIGLAGYSLAGLFAVYAMYRSDLFSRIASASGSLWYPGFVDYVKSHGMKRRPERLYLSLGDKEARTRNPYMKKVQENTELLYGWYRQQGIETTFELNSGNHFVNDTERMAKGIAWILTPAGSR